MLWFTYRQQVLATVATCALVLAACAPDKREITDPPTAETGASSQCGAFGTFAGSATGEVGVELSGCSLFLVTAATEGDQVFGLTLSNGAMANPTHRVYIGRIGGRPDVGTYTIGGGDFYGAFSVIDNGIFSVVPNTHEFALSGTLTIASSTAGSVDGSLDVTGVDAAGKAVTITGAFSAKCPGMNGVAC